MGLLLLYRYAIYILSLNIQNFWTQSPCRFQPVKKGSVAVMVVHPFGTSTGEAEAEAGVPL